MRTREARIWDQCLFSPLSPLFALCHSRQTDRVPSTKGATALIDMLDEETSPRCTREEPHRYILEHSVQEHTVRSSPTDDFVHTSRPPESRCSPHEESLRIISAKRPESPRFVLVQGCTFGSGSISDHLRFQTLFWALATTETEWTDPHAGDGVNQLPGVVNQVREHMDVIPGIESVTHFHLGIPSCQYTPFPSFLFFLFFLGYLLLSACRM